MEDPVRRDGVDVPNDNGDALSNLFTTPEGAPNFLAQCDISAYDRHSIIAERLGNTSDDATRLGRELSARIILGQNLDADFRNDLAARGGEDMITIIRQMEQRGESIDKSSVARALAAQVEGLTRHTRIFEDLPLDQRSEEEGRKRAQGETSLVLAKAGLLELGCKAFATGDFQDAGFAIGSSGVVTSHYPQWFSQGCATALRQYDIPHMTDSDLPTLEQLSRIYWVAARGQTEEAVVQSTTNPDELEPLQYMYRKFWEASQRIEQLKEGERSRQAQAEHDRQLALARDENFRITANRCSQATENAFNRTRSGIFIDEGYLGKLIHLDPSIEQAYFNGQRGRDSDLYSKVSGILGVLRSLSDGDFLTRASLDFADAKSPNYMYNDGTSHNLGSLDRMSPEDAISIVREQIEQQIYAAAFGILTATAEQYSGGVHDQPLSLAVKQVLQIIGQGRAAELLRTSDSSQLERSFTKTQIQFRDELGKCLTEMHDHHSDKAGALQNAILKAAPGADTEVKILTETRNKEKSEADQSFISLEARLVDTRGLAHRVVNAVVKLESLRNDLYLQPERLNNLLAVSGSGEERELTINHQTAARVQQEMDQLRLDLQNQSLSTRDRQSLEKKVTYAESQINLLEELDRYTKKLYDSRFVKSQGVIFKTKTAAYDTAVLADVPVAPNIALEQADSEAGKLEYIADQLETLRTGDRVKERPEIESLQQRLQEIEAKLTATLKNSEASTAQALDYIVKRIFSRVGPLQTLVSQKGSPFYGIFQQR